MSSTVVVSKCRNCGCWRTTDNDTECKCGFHIFEDGDCFADYSPNEKALETVIIDLDVVMPFLIKNNRIGIKI